MLFDCFGLGQCTLDRIALVDGFAAPDTKREFSGLEICGGGPVATALVALSKWGRSCAMAGVVGDDAEGSGIRADLEAQGIDTSRLITRKGSLSQLAFIAVERATGRRTIYWQRPTGAPPDPLKTPPETHPVQARVFLTDGLYPEASLACARDGAGRRVVVDAGTLREGTLALIPHADVFIASESFARAYAGEEDPRACCRKLQEAGVEVAGVTLGERGAIGLVEGRWIEQPAYPVHAVDTTGCGDIFHAAIVEGMLADWRWGRIFECAAWAAAQAATRLGGRAGIPARVYP